MSKPLVTVNEIRALMPKLRAIVAGDKLVPPLDAAMREFGIVSRAQRCAFLANLAHESNELTRWQENLNYSAKRLLEVFPKYFTPAQAKEYAHKSESIANRVYANRMGNGDELSGDGYRHRGRGPIGLTGRDNYRLYGHLLKIDLEGNPDLAAMAEWGFLIAAYFWVRAGCNDLATGITFDDAARDGVILRRICQRVNGGFNGLADRVSYFNRASIVLHPDEPEPAPPAAAPPVATQAAPPETDDAPAADEDDLLEAVVLSGKTKSLWPKLIKYGLAGLAWLAALYEAHRMLGALLFIGIAVGIAFLIYHYRGRLRALAIKVLK